MAQPAAEAPRGSGPWVVLLTAAVFLLALNLRPSLTSVGPLLPQIGRDEGLTKGVQGLLGALPLLTFAAVSPLVHHASRRLGMERVVLLGLGLLTAGIVVRSYAGSPGLWAGTAMVGAAIAVGNVLVPAIMKRDYSAHVSWATGIYTACITVAASVGSAAAVPLANEAGWRGALAFWAIPALAVAVVWFPRTVHPTTARRPSGAGDHEARNVWTLPMAWVLTAFMGLQSTAFYFMVTWLPTIERARGASPEQAGWYLFTYQIVGIASGLAIPKLMGRASQVLPAALASSGMLIGSLGLLLAPQASLLWVVVAGLGSGASLVVALSLFSLRGRTPHETTQLSGMAQSLGYLMAAGGPVLAGVLAESTGGWRASLAFLCVLAALQLVAGFLAGRDRRDPS